MTQDAIVTKIVDDRMAVVTVERGSACGGNCVSCGACSFKNIISTEAVNKISAAVGDRVVIESQSSSIIGAAALVYMVPLAAFFAGYILAVALKLAEPASIIVSLCGFFAGVGAVVLSQRRRRGKPATFSIVSYR